MPERVKYRKMHRGNRAGLATRGNTVAFGEYGLRRWSAAGWTPSRSKPPAWPSPAT